jgi:hypothetical protein
MVFFELRWNYSPLKEKAVLLPDGLFVFFVAKLCFAPHRYGFLLLISGISFSTKICRFAALAPHRRQLVHL